MSIYPAQARAVDPYASYDSNVINRLTRLISKGRNCIFHSNAVDVALDTTSPSDYVVVTNGQIIKDDVLIDFTGNHRVQMSDSTYYLPLSSPFSEAGIYYIALNYSYIKSRPAPRASIRILLPSQRANISDASYLFLKAVSVSFNGVSYQVDSFHDLDPTNNSVKREYTQVWAGTETTLPSFDSTNDESRLIYVQNEKELYFGTSTGWESFNSIRTAANTSLCSVGQMVYISTDGFARPAIATNESYLCDAGVLSVGTVLAGTGKVRLYGFVQSVPIESGRSIHYGENVYLSETEAGSITDLAPSDFQQFLGISVTAGSSTTVCDIWFMPARSSIPGPISRFDRYQDLLLASVFKRLTVDDFSNLEYTDMILTTSTLNTDNYRMEGTSGEQFVSKNLTESGYDGTFITSAQITSDSTGDIDWFITNDGTTWENATLNSIHMFATYSQTISLVSGTFIPNEQVLYGTSGNSAIIAGTDGTSTLLISNVLDTTAFEIFETITGQTSGAIATLLTSVQKNSGFDLRIKAVFNETGNINDYGVIYDPDLSLFSVLTGMGSEEEEDFIRKFVGKSGAGSEMPTYSSTNYISQSSSLETAIGVLDNEMPIEPAYIRTFIGKTGAGSETPTYSSHNILVNGQSLETSLSLLDLYHGYVPFLENNTTGTVAAYNLVNGKKVGLISMNGTDLTTITGGDSGQIIICLFLASCSIISGATILLQGGIDFDGEAGDTLTICLTALGWLEIGRSVNS